MAFRVANLQGSGIKVFYQEGCRVCGSDNNKPVSCLSSEVKVLPGREIYFCCAAFKPPSSWVGCHAEVILCTSVMLVWKVAPCSIGKQQPQFCPVITDITYLLILNMGVPLKF